jgi:hypothetical protein
LDDRVIALQGERRGHIAPAFGSQISLRAQQFDTASMKVENQES